MAYAVLVNKAVQLLVIAHFILSVTSQFATLGPVNIEPASNTSYHLVGTLTSFSTPAACNNGVFLNADTLALFSSGTEIVQNVFSHYSVGCFISGPSSCCPPNWAEAGYYISSVASCPPGYSKLPPVTELSPNFGDDPSEEYAYISYLSSGTQSVWPCCPTVTYSFSKGSTSGVLRGNQINLDTFKGSSGSPYTARCYYLQSQVSQSYTESGTTFNIAHQFWANPLYIFSDETELQTTPQTNPAPTTLATSPSGSSTARPKSTATSAVRPSQTQENSGTPTDGAKKEGSGLSTAAAAGIGVGVGVPVVLAAIFLRYFLTRKRLRSATETLSKPSVKKDAAVEPGIMEHPGGIGGIQTNEGTKGL
ncbi:hypothetical protein TWF694_004490 [Orbilia ellipsospora]|uniref:Uncharacterized protein n=1 Tax=Orbilia ellipsospora TaxID=2528407 RepID=A0AAV9WWE6_9PEZI